jgi:hypothetical protein
MCLQFCSPILVSVHCTVLLVLSSRNSFRRSMHCRAIYLERISISISGMVCGVWRIASSRLLQPCPSSCTPHISVKRVSESRRNELFSDLHPARQVIKNRKGMINCFIIIFGERQPLPLPRRAVIGEQAIVLMFSWFEPVLKIKKNIA